MSSVATFLWPAELAVAFRLIVLDWDGTAVANRREDASPLRDRFARLLQFGVRIVVTTGTHFENVDQQISAAMVGPFKQRLFICPNRGSEVYGFSPESSPVMLYRRQATAEEDCLLTSIAEAVHDAVVARTGLEIGVVYDRLNRRKLDMIPLPEWADPPKSEIGSLRKATDERLQRAGMAGGLQEAVALTQQTAASLGMPNARITSDAKNIEIGLTDKADSMAWVVANISRPLEIPAADILIAGDEFGPVGGCVGSDARMLIPELKDAITVSVGPEPTGLLAGVLHLDGGPARFRSLLDDQIRRWEGL